MGERAGVTGAMIPELRVKIKSLAAEQSMIRLEERRQKVWYQCQDLAQSRSSRTQDAFWSLRDHRLGLRPKVRAALLAYAFLRGRPFPEVRSSSEPDWSRVWHNVQTFASRGSLTDAQQQDLAERFKVWREAGQARQAA